MGGGHMCFVNVSSPPNCMDLDRGRRVGNFEDFQNFIRLTQYFNCIHVAGGYPVEPVDIHASVRHLDCLFEKLTLTDKVVHAYSLGPERVEDVIAMARIASGLPEAEFESQPRLFTNINSSSPLKHDWPMLDGAMRFARRGQPVIVTPFTLAGAMAPGHHGRRGGAVDRRGAGRDRAPAGGEPRRRLHDRHLHLERRHEVRRPGLRHARIHARHPDDRPDGPLLRPAAARLQRLRLQRPRRPGDVGEPELALGGGAVRRQPRLPRRRLARGRADRLLREVRDGLRGAAADPALLRAGAHRHRAPSALATEAIAEVGPHGHFFGADHTQSRYTSAFYAPFLSDWRNYEAWAEAGALTTEQRANRVWKAILAEYQPPPMDDAVRDELADFVARRKREGGAPTDY